MSKFIVFALILFPLTLQAASTAQKYEQARRAALRDPQVRAAYEAADRKLAAKIARIDPALKGYKPGQPAPKATPAPKPAVKAKPTPKPVVKAKPTPKPVAKPKPTPKPVAKSAPVPKVRGKKHKIAPGETLESIAMRYRVGVPTVRQANPGVRERYLQPGQIIIVPDKNTAPPVSQGIPYRKPEPRPAS